jgi:hypothetical protein
VIGPSWSKSDLPFFLLFGSTSLITALEKHSSSSLKPGYKSTALTNGFTDLLVMIEDNIHILHRISKQKRLEFLKLTVSHERALKRRETDLNPNAMNRGSFAVRP